MHPATLAPSVGLSRFVLLAGGVVLTLGIVVMLGWHARNLAVIRVLPTAAPMYYNTALCFVLSGMGYSRSLASGTGSRASLGA